MEITLNTRYTNMQQWQCIRSKPNVSQAVCIWYWLEVNTYTVIPQAAGYVAVIAVILYTTTAVNNNNNHIMLNIIKMARMVTKKIHQLTIKY